MDIHLNVLCKNRNTLSEPSFGNKILYWYTTAYYSAIKKDKLYLNQFTQRGFLKEESNDTKKY